MPSVHGGAEQRDEHAMCSGFIYSALIDSFCSEQNARMTAMDAANQNAEELLDAAFAPV